MDQWFSESFSLDRYWSIELSSLDEVVTNYHWVPSVLLYSAILNRIGVGTEWHCIARFGCDSDTESRDANDPRNVKNTNLAKHRAVFQQDTKEYLNQRGT